MKKFPYIKRCRLLVTALVACALVLLAQGARTSYRNNYYPVTYPDGQTVELFDITVQDPIANVLSYYDRRLDISPVPEDGRWYREVLRDGTYVYGCVSPWIVLDTVRSSCICVSEREGTTRITGESYLMGAAGGCSCNPFGRQ